MCIEIRVVGAMDKKHYFSLSGMTTMDLTCSSWFFFFFIFFLSLESVFIIMIWIT